MFRRLLSRRIGSGGGTAEAQGNGDGIPPAANDEGGGILARIGDSSGTGGRKSSHSNSGASGWGFLRLDGKKGKGDGAAAPAASRCSSGSSLRGRPPVPASGAFLTTIAGPPASAPQGRLPLGPSLQTTGASAARRASVSSQASCPEQPGPGSSAASCSGSVRAAAALPRAGSDGSDGDSAASPRSIASDDMAQPSAYFSAVGDGDGGSYAGGSQRASAAPSLSGASVARAGGRASGSGDGNAGAPSAHTPAGGGGRKAAASSKVGSGGAAAVPRSPLSPASPSSAASGAVRGVVVSLHTPHGWIVDQRLMRPCEHAAKVAKDSARRTECLISSAKSMKVGIASVGASVPCSVIAYFKRLVVRICATASLPATPEPLPLHCRTTSTPCLRKWIGCCPVRLLHRP